MSALIKDLLPRHVTPDRLSLPEAAFYTGLSVNVLSLLVGGGQIRFERMAGVRGVPLVLDRASIDHLLERAKAGEIISYRTVKKLSPEQSTTREPRGQNVSR
jgi:hypothetical protein